MYHERDNASLNQYENLWKNLTGRELTRLEMKSTRHVIGALAYMVLRGTGNNIERMTCTLSDVVVFKEAIRIADFYSCLQE